MIDQTLLHDTLTALGETRAEIAALDAEIRELERPLKEQIEALTRARRERFKALQTEESSLNALGRELYEALQAERIQALHAGSPEAKIEPPAGCTVALLKQPLIEDETRIPIEACKPDTVKIRKLLTAGKEIPGARLVEVPSFRFGGSDA